MLTQVFIVSFSIAQGKFFTRTGQISFYSKAPLENIEAHNNQSTCIFNAENGEMAFSVLMKGFEFEKALMQEHFNENYIESDKYPKATFKGKINNYDVEKIKQNGTLNVEVVGNLTIHGVTKEVITQGIFEIADSIIHANATFPVSVKDHKIKIPTTVIDNIAEKVEVKVQLQLKPYNR